MKIKNFTLLAFISLLIAACTSQPPLPDMQERLDSLKKSYDENIINESTHADLKEDIVNGYNRDKVYVGDRLLSLKKAYDYNAISIEEYQEVLEDIIDGDRKSKPLVGIELIKLKETYNKKLINMQEYASFKDGILDN